MPRGVRSRRTGSCSSAARARTARSRRPCKSPLDEPGRAWRVGGRRRRSPQPQADAPRGRRRRLRVAVGRARRERPGRPSSAATSAWRRRRACPRTRTKARSSSGRSGGAEPARSPRRRGRLVGQRRALRRRWRGRQRPAAASCTGPSPRATGEIPEWKHLEQSDLPTGLTGGAAIVTGPNAVIVGGRDRRGRGRDAAYRANTAPQSPFFQLGLVGATVPGLKIEGEIGQQLGYLNAAGAGHRELRDPAPHRLGASPTRSRHRALVAARSSAARAGRPRRPRAVRARPAGPARSQASMPPSTFVASLRPARCRKPDDGCRPAAQVADDEERPVGRQLRDAGRERGHRHEGRTRRADGQRTHSPRGRRRGAAGPGPRAAVARPRRRRSMGAAGPGVHGMGLQAMTMVGPASPALGGGEPGLGVADESVEVDDDARRARRAGVAGEAQALQRALEVARDARRDCRGRRGPRRRRP